MTRILGKTLMGVAALLCMSVAANATITIQMGNNVGSLQTTTTVGAVGTTSLQSGIPNPYGTPPLFPIVTQLTHGVSITFSPTSDFYARADNINGTQAQSQTFNGSLSFLVTSDVKIGLTVNLTEGGFYQGGNSTANVTGGISVSDFFHVEPTRSVSFATPNLTGPQNSWNITSQDTGFSGTYFTYLVSIDNILHAQVAAAGPDSSAWVDKKTFTLILSTDGSVGGGGPPVPEPASLGVLAMGGLALLARRRRA